jgi:RND family efflux transporter MFP subunit
MKEKILAFKNYYGQHPKRFWVGGIIILLILFRIISGGKSESITVSAVSFGDLKQTVLATGQVTSQTDLGLSFSTSDTVQSVSVSVGSKVYKGQVLASLDNRDEYASLVSARAGYQKVEEGASSEEVAVAESALATAQANLTNTLATQQTLVENARRAFLNTDLTPARTTDLSGTAPTVTGTYIGVEEGSYDITVYSTGNGGYISYTGIETGNAQISTKTPVALGTKGLYIQFPENYVANNWSVRLPNPKSVQYGINLSAYESAQRTSESAISAARARVTEAEAQLALKRAAARPAELEEARAKVLVAQAAYDNTILRAPANGTIVQVDVKVGERVEAQRRVIVLQDVGNLYVEADINEANIARVLLGQSVTMTLDAFGPSNTFTGKIVHIDPSASTTNGVVNYKIKASLDKNDLLSAVRPGMNANMTILIGERLGVLAVPKAAITTLDGISTVNSITNMKRKRYESRTVTTGYEGDGNMVEILTGLSATDSIALVQK